MASIIKVDQIQTAAGGTPTAADLGLNTSGSVLQVAVVKSNTSTSSSTAQSYLDIGLSIDFTPKSSSSLILIEGFVGANLAVSNVTAGYGSKLYIDGIVQTEALGWLGCGSNVHQFSQFHHNANGSANDNYIQSPFSRYGVGQLTAGTTYTIEHKVSSWNSNTVIFNSGGYISSRMTITEIAG